MQWWQLPLVWLVLRIRSGPAQLITITTSFNCLFQLGATLHSRKNKTQLSVSLLQKQDWNYDFWARHGAREGSQVEVSKITIYLGWKFHSIGFLISEFEFWRRFLAGKSKFTKKKSDGTFFSSFHTTTTSPLLEHENKCHAANLVDFFPVFFQWWVMANFGLLNRFSYHN